MSKRVSVKLYEKIASPLPALCNNCFAFSSAENRNDSDANDEIDDDESEGDEIISKNGLRAVQEIINFLKQNSREEGLFRRSGRRELRKQILQSLQKGEIPHFENIAGNCALECAAALQSFLNRLKKPILPRHIQQLILADNPGVAAKVIAKDALGLIHQDVSGRHAELLKDLLRLLRHLTLSAPPSERSELQGSPLPVALLPVFFALTAEDLTKWQQVATRFNELITEATQVNEFESNSFSESIDRNNNHLRIRRDDDEHFNRIQQLPLLYPILRLADNRNNNQIGEIARVVVNPLNRPPPGRLHPVIFFNNNRNLLQA